MDLFDVIGIGTTWINLAIQVAVAIALIVFFWGVSKHFTASSDQEREAARGTMVWGVVAIFIIASFWGIIALVQNTFY
ncbi:hypothetical protein L0Y49_01975 [bacterium]|nr:hypothetical protein [bacterium]MCI0565724.1 hypothetical protein [bacterium]MCI0679856.1 hypothetical protein [bacterium]